MSRPQDSSHTTTGEQLFELERLLEEVESSESKETPPKSQSENSSDEEETLSSQETNR
jgi:hypothetical protein